MYEDEVKKVLIRFPKDVYIKLREAMIPRETNMTQFIIELVKRELDLNPHD